MPVPALSSLLPQRTGKPLNRICTANRTHKNDLVPKTEPSLHAEFWKLLLAVWEEHLQLALGVEIHTSHVIQIPPLRMEREAQGTQWSVRAGKDTTRKGRAWGRVSLSAV